MRSPETAVVDLIEANQRLYIERTGKAHDPVRLNCPKKDLPRHLLAIRDALDVIEEAGDTDLNALHRIHEEAVALRRALRAVLLFVKRNDLDEDEARRLIEQAMAQTDAAGGYRPTKRDIQKAARQNSARVSAHASVIHLGKSADRRMIVKNGYAMRRVEVKRRQATQDVRPETRLTP